MKRIKLIAVIMSLIMIFLTGCTAEKKKSRDDIYLYYINKDETKLVKTVYTPDKTDDVLKQTKNVIRQMNKTSKEVNVITAKPEDVKINNISYLDSIITIDFTSDYEEMTPVREVLLRSAIVLTVSQIDGVGGVAFTVNGENLTNNSDVPVGIMNAASIVDNIGNNTDNLTKVDADIYFGDSSGSRLKAYRYIGSCDQNTSAEKLIIEKLIAGNNGEDYTRTIPKDTTLLSVVTKDGICYVNFDAKFNSESSDIVPQIQIYSVVNSLCELPYINKVQISINGLTNEKLGGEISLNKLFERNLYLVSK
ncbi:MAG: GerMN domain-containing protein [Lachnospiraceae bacterium]|nr:GerMN domain-containing protein [Lachnospiraceae bacterium]